MNTSILPSRQLNSSPPLGPGWRLSTQEHEHSSIRWARRMDLSSRPHPRAAESGVRQAKPELAVLRPLGPRRPSALRRSAPRAEGEGIEDVESRVAASEA